MGAELRKGGRVTGYEIEVVVGRSVWEERVVSLVAGEFGRVPRWGWRWWEVLVMVREVWQKRWKDLPAEYSVVEPMVDFEGSMVLPALENLA